MLVTEPQAENISEAKQEIKRCKHNQMLENKGSKETLDDIHTHYNTAFPIHYLSWQQHLDHEILLKLREYHVTNYSKSH